MTHELAAIISAIAATIGLIFNYWGMRKNTRARQMATFSAVRKQIEKLSGQVHKAGPPFSNWDERFFNEVEWLALLTRKKGVPTDIVFKYYGPTFADWHNIFTATATDAIKNDPSAYTEFKSLVNSLQSNKTSIVVHRWKLIAGVMALKVELSRNI
jgi:hypothetical protein